jgi:DNA-binding transcriptional LysR family regulator
LPELERELWLLSHPDRDAARIRTFIDYCAQEIARRRDVIEGRAPRS